MKTKSLRSIICIFLALFFTHANGQVSINTQGNPPDSSAILDINSADKGLLIPRMTVDQQKMIKHPATGLIVFNIDSADLYIYIGSYWISVLKCEDKDTIYPWNCGDSLTIDHVAGAIAPVNKTVTYGTVTNIPGEPSKCWITSNLGADHQATAVDDDTEASAGWYWQFNRMQGYKHDGSTSTPAWTITYIYEDSDWQTENDPCELELGYGWRVPAKTEWLNVEEIGGWTDWNGPWNSALKMHAAGLVVGSTGTLGSRGDYGHYWSSTQHSALDNGRNLTFYSATSYISNSGKAYGFPIRCIRD